MIQLHVTCCVIWIHISTIFSFEQTSRIFDNSSWNSFNKTVFSCAKCSNWHFWLSSCNAVYKQMHMFACLLPVLHVLLWYPPEKRTVLHSAEYISISFFLVLRRGTSEPHWGWALVMFVIAPSKMKRNSLPQSRQKLKEGDAFLSFLTSHSACF